MGGPVALVVWAERLGRPSLFTQGGWVNHVVCLTSNRNFTRQALRVLEASGSVADQLRFAERWRITYPHIPISNDGMQVERAVPQLPLPSRPLVHAHCFTPHVFQIGVSALALTVRLFGD